MNQVNAVGNLATDVQTREVGDNTVGNFVLAISRPMSKEDRESAEQAGKPTADFVRVTVWNGQAKSCAQYLSKGKKVAVEGSLRSSKFPDKDDPSVTRYGLEVNAQRVEFLSPRDGNGQASSEAEVIAAMPDTDVAAPAGDAQGDDLPF
jgi:single-strand DNA-binding protein